MSIVKYVSNLIMNMFGELFMNYKTLPEGKPYFLDQPKSNTMLKKVKQRIFRKYIIKNNIHYQWFAFWQKLHNFPNFSSGKSGAKKYNWWFIAKLRSIQLRNCTVEIYKK